jgi:curved DNA-binding protein CbpA
MLDVERYYRILELEPGASPEDVHQGYLDLTWVWHPDRFVGNPRLQYKAQCKLQELNEAHAQLRSIQGKPRKAPSLARSNFHKRTPPQPPQYPAPNESLYQQAVNQSASADDPSTKQDSRQRVCFKVRKFDEWLD